MLVLALALCVHLCAQETSVQPLKKSTASLTVTELYGYVSIGPSSTSFKTANENSYTYVAGKKKSIQGGYVNVGAAMCLYNTSCKWFRFNASMGYKYHTYSYQNFFVASSGIFSHWLTVDVNPAFGWWGMSRFGLGAVVGFKTDVLLAAKMTNNDHFSYEGIYPDCFNKADLCLYGGFTYQAYSFKMELCYGAYLIPDLDPKKIAYYNLTETSISGFYAEFKFYYRIFSTGK